ncbi:tlde1 domain-containing protein [Mesorhizobium captivum]|uniref:tlde1 domain-containing protein n=1 Tax=Mesorhizobium captivum TaxID=3072319 RepID=UPI002A246744|nr:tlde1 domain-containing protein [Mesorhizobium sp. VK23E]MDX8512670.1 DUF2778 domain-containing protein [Mesorhizobium sp. VK23E]
MPAVGAALALWSVATLAGLYSVSTSLTAASNGLPQSLLAPRSIALADQRRQLANVWAPRLAAAGATKKGSLTGGCDVGCLSLATSFAHSTPTPTALVHDGKAARLKPAAPDSVAFEKLSVAREKAVEVASAADVADRFDSVIKRAGLSPQKLADAFQRAESAPFLLASLPAASRFGGAADPAKTDPTQTLSVPAEARFGSNQVDVQRPSELALALANVMPEETADVPTAVALANGDAPDLAGDASNDAEASGQAAGNQAAGNQGEVQVASLPPQDDLPDSIAVPGLRPRATLDRAAEAPEQNAARKPEPAKPQAAQSQATQTAKPPAAKPEPAKPEPTAVDTAEGPQSPRSLRSSEQALPGVQGSKSINAAPAGRGKAQPSEMLAYAKPDTPERGGLGNAFRGLFNSPSMANGVAVYDISAKTVYMPDGSRLEAHSGYGSMVDQPRFVNRKNVGPTPPDTYNLSMRESRFHGVEAIRLTPTNGKNKYGRDGLLAHTYMLRGGRAESNGCLVFKDYHRFLAAYKKGKIKRLVVVPRLTRSPTQVAQEGRQG